MLLQKAQLYRKLQLGISEMREKENVKKKYTEERVK